MLDIQFIRDNTERVKQNAQQKNINVNVDELITKDNERRSLLKQVEALRQERNQQADSTKGQKPTNEQVAKGKQIKERLSVLETELETVEAAYQTLLEQVPNMSLGDVPVGASENDNVVAKTVGEPTKFDFEPKNHWQIAVKKSWIDKDRAAKVTGARFAYLKGDLVLLQMALMRFVIDRLTDETVLGKIIAANSLQVSNKPFIPILPPLMLRTELFQAMDRLEPREERYKIEGEDLWLQGSAEHVLGSMHGSETLEEKDLPIRYLGYATSFRKEAGTYGKDMEGIFRLHQFDKLEMESITTAESGMQEHLFLIAIQEHLTQELGIPYRVIMKCTADIGKANARGVDIDSWLPGQNKYRETHTADYMTDYQTRRLQIKVKGNNGQTSLVHTNDATAFALGRIIIAILENYQTADGNVQIPAALQPYLGEKTQI